MGRADRPQPEALRPLVARFFGSSRPVAIEPVAEGVSTFVYRVERGDERFYLRVLPEIGDSFAPEAHAHALLRQRGVSLPEIVHFAHRDETIGLSVLITTEIAGRSIAAHGPDQQTPRVLAAAGRDLARINSLRVAGFGWVRRDAPIAAELTAGSPTNRAFLTEHLEGDLALLGARLLALPELAAIRALIIRHDAWLDADGGQLAHGDFDLTHIFQRDGAYSGIIDFGEIRGTDRWYDLGHFRLHDGERLPQSTLPWLLAGYRSVAPLPDDAERRIAFASLLIGTRALARVWPKRPGSPLVGRCLLAIRREVAFLGRN